MKTRECFRDDEGGGDRRSQSGPDPPRHRTAVHHTSGLLRHI